MRCRVTSTCLYRGTSSTRDRLVRVTVAGPGGEVTYLFRAAPRGEAPRLALEPTDPKPRGRVNRRVRVLLAFRAAVELIADDDGDDDRGDPSGSGDAGPCAAE